MLLTRFDHCVIAARDLEQASEDFRRLGFDVAPGGRHEGRGTHNAIIRFGLEYIELISVDNRAEALASGLGGAALVDFLDGHAGGLVGYCLATENIEELGRKVASAVPGTIGPFSMSRVRPDGRVLEWRLVIPGGNPWQQPRPFFIQWGTPDSLRLEWEKAGRHTLGDVQVAGIQVASSDSQSTQGFYGDVLDLPSPRAGCFQLGDFQVELVEGAGSEGPLELALRVADLEATARVLAAGNRDFVSTSKGLTVAPAHSCGARLSFSQRQFGRTATV